MTKYNIPFSPPDITEAEIAEVADTLRSGWITTGPKTKELERRLSAYTQTPKTVCLNSATAARELILRVLESKMIPLKWTTTSLSKRLLRRLRLSSQ